MATSLPESTHHLFDDANLANVATIMADGSPQVTPVWIDREDGTPIFNTALGRAKHRNLERNPRVALAVVNRDNPYEYVQVRGRAEFETHGAVEHIDKMARKYTRRQRYPLPAGEQRVIVRVIPESVVHWGA